MLIYLHFIQYACITLYKFNFGHTFFLLAKRKAARNGRHASLSFFIVSVSIGSTVTMRSMRLARHKMGMPVANPLVAALNRTGLVNLLRRHAAIVAALHAVALVVALALEANLAGLHANMIAVFLTVAFCLAAPVAILMLSLYVFFTAELIDTRAVISIVAGRLVTAERIIAPEQTAHAACGMRIGIGAQIGIAAAALIRIAIVLLIALTDHMLRNSIAVLAHRLMLMRTILTGIMAFYAAGSGFMLLAVAGIMTRMTAGRRRMVETIGDTMTAAAARRLGMLGAVAGIMAALAAGRLAVIRSIADHVAGLAAGCSLMLHAVTGVVTFLAAGCQLMIFAISNAVPRLSASRLAVSQLITDIMTLGAAGCLAMFLAVAIEMSPRSARCALMVHAVTVKMPLDPTGLGTIMIDTVKLLMARGLACGLGGVIRRQRANRHHAAQKNHRQQHRQNLLQDFRLL